MILAHLLLGIILGITFKSYFFFILGAIFVDFDHILVILKNKLWNLNKIIESIKFEKKFGIRYKTPFFHSLFGLLLFSLIIFVFNQKGGIQFGIAYLTHLIIDWIDIDEKYFLYPLKIKFKGVLPIWSRFEQITTVILILIVLTLLLL